MFLTLFGEKMSGTDPEHEILGAFECFDDGKTGRIDADVLREYMTTMGDRFTDEEVCFQVFDYVNLWGKERLLMFCFILIGGYYV